MSTIVNRGASSTAKITAQANSYVSLERENSPIADCGLHDVVVSFADIVKHLNISAVHVQFRNDSGKYAEDHFHVFPDRKSDYDMARFRSFLRALNFSARPKDTDEFLGLSLRVRIGEDSIEYRPPDHRKDDDRGDDIEEDETDDEAAHAYFLEQMKKSGIDNAGLEIVEQFVGYTSSAEKVRQLLGWKKSPKQKTQWLIFQYHDQNGQPIPFLQVRPRNPGDRGKYETRFGGGSEVYIPPMPVVLDALSAGRPIVLTDGEKRAISLCCMGIPAIAVSGASRWAKARTDAEKDAKVPRELLPRLAKIAASRQIVIAFHGSTQTDDTKNRELREMAAKLRQCGANVAVAKLPENDGIDDVIARETDQAVRDLLNDAIDKLPEIKGSKNIKAKVTLMSDVKATEIDWIWPGRLAAGKIVILAGAPGAGKSFVTLDIAARLSRGSMWPACDEYAPPCGVLLMSAEDDPGDTLRPRLNALGANCSRIGLLTATTSEGDSHEREIALSMADVDVIRDALEAMPGVRLVVIDPVGSFLPVDTDAHRDNEVRYALAPLVALAREKRVAVLLVAHTRKSKEGTADDSVLGSRAFTGVARTVFHVLADPADKNRKYLASGKTNIGAPAPTLAFAVVDDGCGALVKWEEGAIEGLTADELMAGPHRGRSRDEGEASTRERGRPSEAREAAGEWLVELLTGHGDVPVQVIQHAARDAGMSWATIRRAKDDLGIRPTRRDGQWTWRLPGDEPQTPAHVARRLLASIES